MKKLLIFVTAFLLTCNTVLAAKYTYIEEKKSESIGQGIVHENILEFNSDGFQNINVIKFNLKDQSVELVPLYNTESLARAKETTKLSSEKNVVAGINSDFFNFSPMFPLGMVIEKGEMIYSNSDSSNPTPSIIMDNEKNLSINRFEISMNLRIGEKNIPVGVVNKPNGYGSTGLYTRKWGAKSRGGKVNSQTEIAISGGVVVDRKDAGEPLNIPEDGFVVNIKDGLYLPNVGERVEFEINGININNISFGMGAGSIILENSTPKKTHIQINGKQPRTLFGYNRNTLDAVLVTVDGRSSYKGLTMEECSELLLKLQMTDGVNLDGGGSTTLAIKNVNTSKMEIKNFISSERKVATGIGVKSNSTIGAPSKMVVKVEDNKMFKNTSKWVSIKIYDEYGNPLPHDSNQINLSANLPINSTGGKFTALQSGKLLLNVNYQNLTETVELEVLESPQVLILDRDTLFLGPNETYRIPDIIAVDGVGNRALIRSNELNVSVIGNVGNIQSGVFVRNNNKSDGAIVLNFANAKHRIVLPKNGGKIGINPMGELKNLSHSNNANGARTNLSIINDKRPVTRLWYNFEKSNTERIANINFKNTNINPNSSELSVFVKNLGDFEIFANVNVENKNVEISFEKNINLLGYTEYRGKLPHGATKLNSISFRAPKSESTKKGHIDIKDIAGVINPDTSKMYTEYVSRFFDPLENNKLSSNDIAVVVLGDGRHISGVEQNFSNFNKVLFQGRSSTLSNRVDDKITELDDLLIANFSVKQGGLKDSDIEQWNDLLNKISSSEKPNIIISLAGKNKSSLGIINNTERRLFKETLEKMVKEGKRVFVISNLEENTSLRYEEGVRYINLNPGTSEYMYFNLNRVAGNIIYGIRR